MSPPTDAGPRRRGQHIGILVLSAALIGAGAAVAVGVLPLWTLLVLVALVCPFVILWIYGMSARPLPVPIDPAPPTRAVTLNWLAPWYDALCAHLRLGAPFRAYVLAAAALRPGERVLDLGCCTGALAREASQVVGPGGAVWGIDPAPDMIRLALQSCAVAQGSLQFRAAVPEQLPFEGRSFDVALASLVLWRLPSDLRSSALAEVVRVLRPGGRLIVADLDQSVLGTVLLRNSSLPVHLRGRMEAFLLRAGFTGIRRAGHWGPAIAIWTASTGDQVI